jgi:hypothetical protein
VGQHNAVFGRLQLYGGDVHQILLLPCELSQRPEDMVQAQQTVGVFVFKNILLNLHVITQLRIRVKRKNKLKT